MVYHILKDGRLLTDISGHVVKIADVPQVYDLISRLERKSKIHRKVEKKEA